jgi:hypothetical protein
MVLVYLVFLREPEARSFKSSLLSNFIIFTFVMLFHLLSFLCRCCMNLYVPFGQNITISTVRSPLTFYYIVHYKVGVGRTFHTGDGSVFWEHELDTPVSHQYAMYYRTVTHPIILLYCNARKRLKSGKKRNNNITVYCLVSSQCINYYWRQLTDWKHNRSAFGNSVLPWLQKTLSGLRQTDDA